jgi:hypothetical protein
MGEVLFESQDRHLRIERHKRPPAGFVELLSRVVWGTGAVRYTVRDVDERVAAFQGSHFLALRERGALVGTYALAPRTIRAGGATVSALYRTLLSVAPGRGREGLGRILVREARRRMLERAGGPVRDLRIRRGRERRFARRGRPLRARPLGLVRRRAVHPLGAARRRPG